MFKFWIIFLSLNMTLLAKANKVSIPKPENPNLTTTLQGGLGFQFGTSVLDFWNGIYNKGFQNVFDTSQQYKELIPEQAEVRSRILLIDSTVQKYYYTNPLNLNGIKIEILTMLFGPQHTLEGFDFQFKLPNTKSNRDLFNTQKSNIEKKYGKGYCEVANEQNPKWCDVLSWDFGSEAELGQIQLSLPDSVVHINYKSPQAMQRILREGSTIVQEQFNNTPNPALNDY